MNAYVLDNFNLTIKDHLQFETYEFSEDIDFGEKGSIVVGAEKVPNISNDDFVLCQDGDEVVFVGICTDFDSSDSESGYTINLAQKETLFDREIFIENEDLLTTGIEDFVKQAIEDNWTASNDTVMDMLYTTVTCTTHTPVDSKVSTIMSSDDDNVFNLKTFLGNAKEQYGLFVKFVFADVANVTHKALNIQLYKDTASQVSIDVDNPDVAEWDETYDVDVLARLRVKWNLKGEYTPLEWLKSDGSQYIDTGYQHQSNTWIEVKFTAHDMSTYRTFYGAATSDNSSDGFTWGWNSSGGINADLSTLNPNPVSGTTGKIVSGQTYIFKGGGVGCYINDDYYSIGATVATSTVTDGIFNRHLSSSWSSEPSLATIYYVKIYEGTLNDTDDSELKYYFIPGKRISDSAYGMFDTVHGEFYANAGSGTFTAGSDISSKEYYLKTDRTTTTTKSDPDRASGVSKSVYMELSSPDELEEQALNEFKSNSYEHKVSFKLSKKSAAYPISDFFIGRSVQFKTKTGIKDSLVTCKTISSDSAYATLTFGTLKVTLIEKLRSLQ